MRHIKLFIIIAVPILLIGTSSVKSEDGVPGQPFQNLQNQIDDNEARIDDLETNDAAQDSQLADHKNRIGDLEQQAPAAGITVRDNTGNILGILLGYDRQWPYYTQVFVPSLKKTLIIEPQRGRILSSIPLFYTEPDCDGDAFIWRNEINDFIFQGYSREFYTVDTTATPTNITYKSYGEYDYNTGGYCNNLTDTGTGYYPVIPVPPGTLPFSNNVNVPLHYEY